MSDATKNQPEAAVARLAWAPPSVWLALVAGLFVAFSWLLPYGWTVAAGVFLILAGLVMLAKPDDWLKAVTAVFIIIFILVYLGSNFFKIKDSSHNGYARAGVRAIQLALERYATDYDVYPITIDPLRIEGYLPWLPENRFAGRQYDLNGAKSEKEAKQMQPLGADYLPEDLQPKLALPGNFCYLPRLETDDESKVQAVEYLLLVIGNQHWQAGWNTPPVDVPVVLDQLRSDGLSGYGSDSDDAV